MDFQDMIVSVIRGGDPSSVVFSSQLQVLLLLPIDCQLSYRLHSGVELGCLTSVTPEPIVYLWEIYQTVEALLLCGINFIC